MPSNYRTLKWMPLDENGSPVQYFDNGYEFSITAEGVTTPSKHPRPPIKAIDNLYRENGLVRTYLYALLNATENGRYLIPWENFNRKLVEICTGNQNQINGFANNPHHRKLFWGVMRRPLDFTIMHELDKLPRIPVTLIDPDSFNRIEIMSPILTDDKGSRFVLVNETSPDGTMEGVSAISIDKLRRLKPIN